MKNWLVSLLLKSTVVLELDEDCDMAEKSQVFTLCLLHSLSLSSHDWQVTTQLRCTLLLVCTLSTTLLIPAPAKVSNPF